MERYGAGEGMAPLFIHLGSVAGDLAKVWGKLYNSPFAEQGDFRS